MDPTSKLRPLNLAHGDKKKKEKAPLPARRSKSLKCKLSFSKTMSTALASEDHNCVVLHPVMESRRDGDITFSDSNSHGERAVIHKVLNGRMFLSICDWLQI